MLGDFKIHLSEVLKKISQDGLYKEERIITSPQSGKITVKSKKVLNFSFASFTVNSFKLSTFLKLKLTLTKLSRYNGSSKCFCTRWKLKCGR